MEKEEIKRPGKQIRVFVSDETYKELKKKAKECSLTLRRYAGLKLSGYKIEKTEAQEK